MTVGRRMDLITLMAETGIPILEDNPYSELRYTGQTIPSIFKLAEMQNMRGLVTLVKSFSKILGPGLRIAYAVSSEEIIGKMCSWQQKVNVTPDCVAERMVARFMEKDLLSKQIKIINELYTPYWEAMLESLYEYMPEYVEWTKPEGGMFIWLTLPSAMDADELFIKAREQKVSFIPGSKFYPRGQERTNCLRLNFSYAKPEVIREGIKRLASIM
jgi:2-aminoadipate transaminase